MAEGKRITKVANHPIGSGPALAYYFEKMNLVRTIDEQVVTDPRRTELSHGQAVAGLVTMVLNHSHALYQMERWATENKMLSTIFPGIPASAYTDDRLSDTLDALYAADLDTVGSAVTVSLIKGFSVTVQAVHHDTTTFSFYGAYEGQTQGPRITNGFSKEHRPDLKQIVYAVSVNEDQIPLLGQALDGHFSDGPNYLEHWKRLSQILPRSDFLYLGDTKMASAETLRYIMDHDGVFLCAQALVKGTKKQVAKALKKAKWQFEPFKPIPGRVSPEDLKGYGYIKEFFQLGDGEKYRVRRLIIRSEELAKKHQAKRQSHVQKVENGLKAMANKLNRYTLKTEEAIKKAIDALFDRYTQAKGLIPFKITSQTIQRHHYPGKGRPKAKEPARREAQTVYHLHWKTSKKALEKAARWDGIFLRITNATEDRVPNACMLSEYKGQWKVERQHRLLKGPIALTPTFLHKPERIAALALVCLIAVQVLRVMELEAARALMEAEQTLVGLYPNRIATANPPALRMVQALSTIEVLAVHERKSKHPAVTHLLTSLTPLQKKILTLLGVPRSYYSQRNLFLKLKILKT